MTKKADTSNNAETPSLNIADVVCCDLFKAFIPTFEWMQTTDKVLVMPHVQFGENKVRVNHCPSCGAYVRNIEITEAELTALL